MEADFGEQSRKTSCGRAFYRIRMKFLYENEVSYTENRGGGPMAAPANFNKG